MDKKPLESKKFIALLLGVTITILFTVGGLIFIYMVPSASADIVNLITIALASINGCISLYAILICNWTIGS
jgi:hypothetical protein